MKVVWTRRAVHDLAHVRQYIERDDVTAAAHVAKQILVAARRLAAHPQIGRPGRLKGTRELVITGTAYVVPYRIHAKTVQLLRVLHGRQQWPEESRLRVVPSSGLSGTKRRRRHQ